MEYRGTTAAGLSAMMEANIEHAIFNGLTAARRKAAQSGS